MGKKEQADATRKRILAATRELAAKRGFFAMSMAELASAIGMTQGVLYWHFESKEELLLATVKQLQENLLEELAAAGAEARATDGPGVMLGKLIHRVAEIVEREPAFFLFIGTVGVEATDANPRVEIAVREAYGTVAGFLEQILVAAVAEGTAVPPPDLACVAHLFLGLYMGGILQQRLFRGTFPLARALPTLERMMAASVGLSSPTLDAAPVSSRRGALSEQRAPASRRGALAERAPASRRAPPSDPAPGRMRRK